MTTTIQGNNQQKHERVRCDPQLGKSPKNMQTINWQIEIINNIYLLQFGYFPKKMQTLK
jgi:hypothetical protein